MGHPILESPLLFPRTVCSYLSEGKEEKTTKKETGKPVWKTKAPKSFTRGCQGGKQTHRQAHLYTLSSGIFITEPGNILFPLGGFGRGPAPSQHLPRLWNGAGALCSPGRNAPHRSGNGSGAAGAETLGAAAKKSACPSLTRASQLKRSRVPALLLRATSVGLSHDVLVSLRQDLWRHDVLLDQASINLPRATESSPPATCRRRTQHRVHFALCLCRSHPGTLEETQGLH